MREEYTYIYEDGSWACFIDHGDGRTKQSRELVVCDGHTMRGYFMEWPSHLVIHKISRWNQESVRHWMRNSFSDWHVERKAV